MDRRHFLQTTAALSLASATSSTAHSQPQNQGLTGKAALTEQLNPTIQDARNVALSILKPSEKELQRGLELHAASMVFDTYGFSPRAAIDGDRMKTLVEAGASDIEVKDLSEQMDDDTLCDRPHRTSRISLRLANFGSHVHFPERGRRRTRPSPSPQTVIEFHLRHRHAERLCGQSRRFPMTLPPPKKKDDIASTSPEMESPSLNSGSRSKMNFDICKFILSSASA